ncbi:MAG: hypothetical protein ACR2GG_10915 [Gemmatimonadaceae bacterium]
MAEIPIERKPRSNILPIVLGVLALLAIIWFLMGRCNNNTAPAVSATDSTTAPPTPAITSSATPGAAAVGGPVGPGATSPDSARNVEVPNTGNANVTAGARAAIADFTRFVNVTNPNTDENEQHTYAAGGIRRLAEALAALGAPAAPIANMRQQATALLNSSRASAMHADMTRSACLSAADAFASLKGSTQGAMAGGNTSAVTNVRNAATAITPGAHLLEQKDRIQAFFVSAKNALPSMTQAR